MDYEKLVDVALNIGEVMLKHGAETYRVEDTMRRILSTVKSEYRDAYVIYTGVVVTLTPPGQSAITKVKRIENKGSNYNKIYLANNLSRNLCDGKISIEEAEVEIQRIRDSRVFPAWAIAVSTIMVTSMFAVMFGGGVMDSVIAGINGMIVMLGKDVGRILRLPGFICDMIISAAMAFFTCLAIQVLHVEAEQSIIITSSIMTLVPGVAITNAIRDTLQGDYMSGISRVVEAFVIAAGIAVGIGVGLVLFNMAGGAWGWI